MSDIRIVCGDPTKGPASFTRFVLPFAYKIEKAEGTSYETHYQPITLSNPDPENMDIWRRRYFTDETEEVLFRRAKWFQSNMANQEAELTFHNDCKRTVVIRSPMLVLFEFPESPLKSADFCEILQTGMLVQEVYFKENSSATYNELLELNELFRYWQKPFDGHDKKEGDYLRLIKPLLVSCNNTSEKTSQTDDPNYLDRWTPHLCHPVFIGNELWNIVTEDSSESARLKATGAYLNKPDWKGDPGWLIHADNRTFVWCCALLEEGGATLRKHENRESEPLRACDYWRWIRLLNVDSPGWGEVSEFERKWAEERTYTRWEHMGTFYGYCYHSGVMLAPPKTNPELWKNFGAMYFDQMLLLLYLRTTLFRFSVDLNSISSRAIKSHDKDQDEWGESFQKLRWSFSLFANLYQFPLLSNQQQGLEMYTLQRKMMEVDDLFREMKEEIHNSYEFLVVRQDREQTEQGARLNVVATIGLIGAIATGFLGMNIIPDSWNKAGGIDSRNFADIGFGTFFVVMLICFFVVTLALYFSTNITKWFSRISKCGEKEQELICRRIKEDMK